MRKELTAPWHKESDEKPPCPTTVIAVKYWESDGKYHGGENEWNGKQWCSFLGMPNASAPDYWCFIQDHREGYKQLVEN